MLPVGFFMGLKLTGMVLTSKPPVPETVSLGPVLWQVNFTAGEGIPFDRELNATSEDACLMTFTTVLSQMVPGLTFYSMRCPLGYRSMFHRLAETFV